MNFIHEALPISDKELFFGPLAEEDTFSPFTSSQTMADLVVTLGVFPSLSQARKNGWAKPIPSGFSEHKIGKRRFHVLNIFDDA